MESPRIVLGVIASGFAVLAGCSATIPTTPHGVLSTIHQKTLALATERALEQNQVSAERLGQERVHLGIEPVPETDLGKQHVVRVAKDKYRKAAAELVESIDNATRVVELGILSAGVDVTNGAFFGFTWLETTAEVTIRAATSAAGGTPVENESTGVSVYQQTWWLGIGPTEKLK